MMQETYVMVKPGFANNADVVNEIKRRIFDAGLSITECTYINYDNEHAQKHYHEHVGKDFYPALEEYITSDKAYGMRVYGDDAIAKIREIAGSTKNPAPGTIRYDIPNMLGIERDITKNVVHSSDSPESAELELSIFRDLQYIRFHGKQDEKEM